jgi:RNA polymerase sigma-70 factor (ECF subfamily)
MSHGSRPKHLAGADRAIARGAERIENQRALIAAAERKGLDTQRARNLLNILLAIQTLHQEHRQLIVDVLRVGASEASTYKTASPASSESPSNAALAKSAAQHHSIQLPQRHKRAHSLLVWQLSRRRPQGNKMPIDNALRDEMLAEVPHLRAFATSLCGNQDYADDLVQETLLRALTNSHSFLPGTNMGAWLFTILRNAFFSDCRKRRREVGDADGVYAQAHLRSHPEQNGHMEFEELRQALASLPDDQREAIILVGASGFAYRDAAKICGCATGTVKSRVNRARTRLAELMSIETVDDFGPDRTTIAALRVAPRGSYEAA